MGYATDMERESNKHNPRVDEEMKRETAPLTHGAPVDSRAQESREPEGPADGEPTSDEVISTRDETPPRSLPDEQIELRRDLARYLERAIFPASREEILENAREAGAPDLIVREFERLPTGRFQAFPDVWAALGGEVEGGRRHA
jgi:hypothetical protein